jgi:uncharacterized protein YcfJ
MKKSCILAFVGLSTAPYCSAVDFFDVAPVVSVTPLYGPVADTRECTPGAPGAPRPEMVGAPMPQQGAAPPPPAPPERSIIAPAVGGVAGAMLGSQVGSGRGRDAATAVGAVAGTVVGDRIANPNSPSSTTGALVGGAAGALLGNQVGQGSGRTAATGVGAVAGAMIGDRMMSPAPGTPAPAGHPQAPVAAAPMGYAPPPGAGAPIGYAPPPAAAQPCRVVDGGAVEGVRGYAVVYRYSGRDITTTLPYHPGQSLRIAIGAVDSSSSRQAAPAPAYAPVGAPQHPAGAYPAQPAGGAFYPR